MDNQTRQNSESAEEILVAVDASPHSLAALTAAADLAALLGQRLHALYVEDVNLLRLAGLPFCREVGSYTASVRLLDSRAIERTFQRSALDIQRFIERVTQTRRVSCTFHVERGGVADTLTLAARRATLISLGRVGHSPGRRIGSTTQMLLERLDRPLLIASAGVQLQPPFTVFFTGSPASHNALRLAARLAKPDGQPLHVWVWSGGRTVDELQVLIQSTADLLATVDFEGLVVHSTDQLRELLRRHTEGALILPIDQVEWIGSVQTAVIVTPA